MSRESKIITQKVWDDETTVKHHESFGWELLSLDSNRIIMTRETQNPVYDQLVAHERRYYNLIDVYKSIQFPKTPLEPKKFSFKICFWLFVCLVIPSIFYITIKILQRKKYKEQMALYKSEVDCCNARKSRILEMIEETITSSRTLFFTRQV